MKALVVVAVLAVSMSAVFVAVSMNKLDDGVPLYTSEGPIHLAGNLATVSTESGQPSCEAYRLVPLTDPALNAAAEDGFRVFLGVVSNGSRALLCRKV